MGRRSSVEHASFFFKPVQFHLQPAYLFVERVLPRFRGLPLPGPPVHEKLRKLLHRRLPPLSDLNRMHLELRTQLAQRLLAPNRLHRHARFEGRTVLSSRRRHLLLLCLNDSPNSNLLPGLNSWDHYKLYLSHGGQLLSQEHREGKRSEAILGKYYKVTKRQGRSVGAQAAK